MRVELALIVAILFFCCWCAYIIVKMNSSVSTTQQSHTNNNNHLQPLASDANFLMRLNNNGSDISSYLYSNQHQQTSSTQAPMLSVIGRNNQPIQHLRQQNILLPNANTASYVRQESSHQPTTATNGRYYSPQTSSTTNVINQHDIPPQPLHQPKPPYSALTNSWTTQATLPTSAQSIVNRYSHRHNGPNPSTGNNWPNQYYQNSVPAQNNWQPRVGRQSYIGRPSNYYARYSGQAQIPTNTLQQSNPWRPTSSQNNFHAKHRGRSSIDYPESSGNLNADQQAPNESDSDPDPDNDATKSSEGNQGEEEQPAPSNEQGASTDEEQQPELNREIEERNGQRSFSEDQSDANERDRAGNVLITHHKHLINGKPVDKENRAAVERKKAEEKNKNADFEKIANEIEEENQNTPDYDDGASGQQETGESRQRDKVIEPSGSGLINLGRPIIGPGKTMNRHNYKPKLNNQQARDVKSQRQRYSKRKELKIDEDELDEADPLPKRGRESHEHKLKESLTAKQWDDDASSSPTNDNKSPNKTELPNIEDGEQLESSSSTDGSNVKQEDSASDDNQNSVDTKEEMEAEGETGPQQVEAGLKELDLIGDPEKFMHSDRRKKREAGEFNEPKKLDPAKTIQLSIDSMSKLNNSSKVSLNEVEFDDTDTVSVDKTTMNSDPRQLRHDEGKEQETVSGQEDINHEMAAILPMVDENNSSSDEQQSNQAVAIDVLPPPMSNIDQIQESQPTPLEGPYSSYSTFYENQQEGGHVNHLAKPPDQVPSSITFHQNGHSSGPYDVPPPQYHHGSQENGANQEIQAVQQQQPQYHNDIDQFHLTQFRHNPPVPLPAPPPPSEEPVDYHTKPLDHQIDRIVEPSSPQMQDKRSNAIEYNPLASGSKSKSKKVKKKFKKSKLAESKRKAALAQALKKKSKSKKGGGNKKKHETKKKSSITNKEFKGVKSGKKKSKGGGQQGGNKGNLYYKDKGYKKRGFKKAYQKLEAGDHKTYFDEFRDKDHNKKWKKFKDKHNYSQNKRWKGKDDKKYHNYDSKEMKDKKFGVSKHKASSKYKKASKHASDKAYEKKKRMKRKKKEMIKKSKDKYD